MLLFLEYIYAPLITNVEHSLKALKHHDIRKMLPGNRLSTLFKPVISATMWRRRNNVKNKKDEENSNFWMHPTRFKKKCCDISSSLCWALLLHSPKDLESDCRRTRSLKTLLSSSNVSSFYNRFGLQVKPNLILHIQFFIKSAKMWIWLFNNVLLIQY